MKTSGLSLAEAHASGRRYKHKDDTSFTRFRDIGLVCFTYAVSKEWELEPEAKLLTREGVTFTQALTRIEELLKERKTTLPGQFVVNVAMTKELLEQHADSIVQLAKVARSWRNGHKTTEEEFATMKAYDLLMHGEEKK